MPKRIDYATLRAEVPIRWILERIHFRPLSVSGDQWRGACPLPHHPPRVPREQTFSVNVRRDIYQCFRCQSAGNQIDLWSALTQLSQQEAARDLYQYFYGIALNPETRNPRIDTPRTTPPATPGTS